MELSKGKNASGLFASLGKVWVDALTFKGCYFFFYSFFDTMHRLVHCFNW